jgi:hypothetical protein
LRCSWLAVCDRLNAVTRQIKEKQTDMIPEVSYDDFFTLSDAEKDRLKDVGCFVVRGTVPEETAETWFRDLQTYVDDNKDVITGEDLRNRDFCSHAISLSNHVRSRLAG